MTYRLIDGHEDADDGGQPGKIENEREDQIEITVQVR